MIRTIGVLCQDANSRGFLLGVRRRLLCEAEFVEPQGSIAKSTTMTRAQAKQAWLYFQRRGVDLVVRFTDADGNRWQEIRSAELKSFPDESGEFLVCGVAVNNVEQLLALDCAYLQTALDLDLDLSVLPPDECTSVIKKAIIRQRPVDEPAHSVVERLVADAPTDVFRKWLKSPYLERLYNDLRHAAKRNGCEVPNELDKSSDEDV